MSESCNTSTSHLLAGIARSTKHELTYGELVETLHESGIAIILFLFALPMALPLPATGLGLILGVPILLGASQLILGRDTLWLPERIARKPISKGILRRAIHMILPTVQRLEKVIHPRMHWVCTRAGHRIIGVVCLACGISVALPFPFTNTLPSMGVCIVALGLLERDGLTTLLGVLFSIAGVGLVIYAYIVGLDVFTDWIEHLWYVVTHPTETTNELL